MGWREVERERQGVCGVRIGKRQVACANEVSPQAAESGVSEQKFEHEDIHPPWPGHLGWFGNDVVTGKPDAWVGVGSK